MCDVATAERPQTSRQALALLAKDGGLRNRRDALSRRPGPVRDGARDPGSILTYRQSSAETPSLAVLLGRLKRGDKAAAKPAHSCTGQSSAIDPQPVQRGVS